MKYALVLIFVCSSLFASEDFKKFYKPVEGKLPYFVGEDLNPIWDIESRNNLIRIGSQQVNSHLVGPMTEKDYNGKISAVSFFFASCEGYCPLLTKTIKYAHDQFKHNQNVMFVSYSVTPTLDTTKNLNDYADKYQINNDNWHLINGNRSEIYNIARKQLYADMAIELGKDEDQFVHTENVYLIDQERYVRGIYNATKKASMLQLAEDMKKLEQQ